jgi:hypothetical protein
MASHGGCQVLVTPSEGGAFCISQSADDGSPACAHKGAVSRVCTAKARGLDSRLIGSVTKRRLVDGSVVRILVGGPEL